ncbi:MAG: SUMF1/EgtB/PvdO family nonheme iron enzyme [Pseudomonadota bacterium]
MIRDRLHHRRAAAASAWRALCILTLCLAAGMANAAGQRLALVIGNAAYADSPLKNPVNDARAIDRKLSTLGFKVQRVENLKRQQIGRTVTAFVSTIHPGDEVVVFYAGHGVQVKGVNYLPAVDADIQSEDDVALNSLNLNALMDRLDEAKAGLKLLFLDACRNNPYARSFRGGERGLARVASAPSGTLIHFATRPGSVAADGSGANGLYTSVLLRHLDAQNVPIEMMLKRVAAAVEAESKGLQEPWSEGSIRGEFYFNTLASVVPEHVPPSSHPSSNEEKVNIETQSWLVVEQDNSVAAYEAYLEQYPHGKYVPAARVAVLRLKTEQATATEARAWREAQLTNTTAAYGAFIVEHPNGAHSGAAQIKLATLKNAQRHPPQTERAEDGTSFRDCPQCPEMVWLSPGNVTVGSNENEDEKPMHTVKISYKLAVGKYPLTRGQFAYFVQQTGYAANSAWRNTGFEQTDEHPVVKVTWEDAQAFLKWIRKSTGKPYRLLTEAEYEYAARAGTTTNYYWGSQATHDFANYGKELCCGGTVEGRDQWLYTSPVGSFAANKFGLFDMLGNVWAWTEDCGNGNYLNAPSDGSAAMSGDCDRRMLRGGSWMDRRDAMRAANRIGIVAASTDINIGFRIARTAP